MQSDSDSAQVVFTDSAADRVRNMVAEQGDADLKLRVFVRGGGCSGFQYGFEFDSVANEDDFAIDNRGVTLLVDALSFQYLMGSEVDYKDDLLGARFTVTNPNATATCGCGSSFAI
ncbi:MAG: iron-sulfur cluster insertion protein ErpA [Gammaproteobacteria bacterium]|nr:iron-sulfur cluster insertion protein ErpA [Gammaproteobacteria bacterium]